MTSLRGQERREFPLAVRKLAFKRCCVEGCHNPISAKAKGLCRAHYCRALRGSKTALQVLEQRLTCAQCDKPLSGKQRRHCSPQCAVRHHRGTPETLNCVCCGKLFAARQRQTTCSPSCSKELAKAGFHSRRAAIRGREREVFSATEIFQRDKYICQLCGKKTDRGAPARHPLSPSLDHILPIKHGGGHTRVNTQCAHLQCNVRKQGRPLGQMRLFG